MKIAVLGGGISGLSALHFLNKAFGDAAEVTLFESQKRVGGWIQSLEARKGLVIEAGPRSLRPHASTLQLLQDVGILKDAIPANKAAKARYLLIDDKLCNAPYSKEVLSRVLPALLHERKQEGPLFGASMDESVRSFFTRRLSSDVADYVVDPVVSGIWAANTEKLSMQATFGKLRDMEREYGNLTRAVLSRLRQEGRNHDDAESSTRTADPIAKGVEQSDQWKMLLKTPIYSFPGGLSHLPNTLYGRYSSNLQFSNPIEVIENDRNGGVRVNGSHFDYAVSAMPRRSLQAAVSKTVGPQAFHGFRTASLVVVNVTLEKRYKKNIGRPGFGHLIPSNQGKDILGVVYDSCVFPEQDRGNRNTRLTVMMGGDRRPDILSWSDEKVLDVVRSALKEQLNVDTDRISDTLIWRHVDAIPQYDIGHLDRVRNLEFHLRSSIPGLSLVGNSFYGVGVNDCVHRAKSVAEDLSNRALALTPK
ncbi:mitochondrial heme biosynthesis protoporphyrinogen oxidase [Andalucia godoyi]|uniref:Protoporphyrinogen oxidase n=1 Tax=Andalucia godoyi TaxID=505711 RepID=A0A8K0AHC5_ANDGO|nr:mitochondrial heme biosynthesis protoporphyrinogen oxidase [Andalucia godoyi]|eukprot:ANDGO_01225.mRNA.1 mitochondrial heme biosynthesis protoporphyrinogen oxidase